MKCPNCDNQMHMTDRQGVEIDFCRNCRGIWLDRGELDKLIELSNFAERTGAGHEARADRGHERHRSNRSEPGRQPKKRKESFLSDLLDFG